MFGGPHIVRSQFSPPSRRRGSFSLIGSFAMTSKGQMSMEPIRKHVNRRGSKKAGTTSRASDASVSLSWQLLARCQHVPATDMRISSQPARREGNRLWQAAPPRNFFRPAAGDTPRASKAVTLRVYQEGAPRTIAVQALRRPANDWAAAVLPSYCFSYR